MPDRTAALARILRVAKPAPDGDLLTAFVRSKDPAAFEALVRRHGPLVLAACRARELLRKRLERRGITLSAGLLAAVAVPAGVSAEWARRLIEMAPSPVVVAAARAAAGSGLRIAPTLSLAAMAVVLAAGTVL